MTASNCKHPITPEMVERFATYRRREPSWGVLHVAFDDGNWLADLSDTDARTDEERALLADYRLLTESQRRRLRRKAEDAAGPVAERNP